MPPSPFAFALRRLDETLKPLGIASGNRILPNVYLNSDMPRGQYRQRVSLPAALVPCLFIPYLSYFIEPTVGSPPIPLPRNRSNSENYNQQRHPPTYTNMNGKFSFAKRGTWIRSRRLQGQSNFFYFIFFFPLARLSRGNKRGKILVQDKYRGIETSSELAVTFCNNVGND